MNKPLEFPILQALASPSMHFFWLMGPAASFCDLKWSQTLKGIQSVALPKRCQHLDNETPRVQCRGPRGISFLIDIVTFLMYWQCSLHYSSSPSLFINRQNGWWPSDFSVTAQKKKKKISQRRKIFRSHEHQNNLDGWITSLIKYNCSIIKYNTGWLHKLSTKQSKCNFSN